MISMFPAWLGSISGSTGGSITPPVTQFDFYVSQSGGLDTNPGSFDLPFATITKGCSVLDGTVGKRKLGLMNGYYRETPTVLYDGTVTNQIYIDVVPGHTVTVSGCNLVNTSWTNVGTPRPEIYKTTITLPLANNFSEDTSGSNTNLLANQFFHNGDMRHLARWPKVTSQAPITLLDRGSTRARSATVNGNSILLNSIVDNGIPVTGLNNGKTYVWVTGWFLTQTRLITGQPSQNTIQFADTINVNGDKFRKFYYICNNLNLLTTAGEWHYDSGTLYHWPLAGGAPSGTFEYKARNWGFNLSGRNYINITGVKFHGCDPVYSSSASPCNNCTVDKIDAKYINHYFIESNPGSAYHKSALQTGCRMVGSNNVMKNSEFRYAAGMGMWIGTGGQAINNYLDTISYGGMYSAPFKPVFGASNGKIRFNTSIRTGRGAVELTQDNSAAIAGWEIAYNDFSIFNCISVDGGSIYGSRGLNSAGLRIHHNFLHDTGVTQQVRDEGLDGIQITGVYWDQGAGPAMIDHNVMVGGFSAADNSGMSGDIYIQRQPPTNGATTLYNNILGSQSTSQSYTTYENSPPDIMRNNFFARGRVFNWGAGQSDNAAFRDIPQLSQGVSNYAQFFSGTNLSLQRHKFFKLKSGADGINGGVVLAGITDGAIGAPDIGAFEFGGAADVADWECGYVSVM